MLRRLSPIALGLACALAGCVVTTYEGQGKPPDAPAPSIPVSTGRAPTSGVSTPMPRADGPKAIAASHVLVQWRGSMRAPPDIIRSKEEARQRAEDVLAKARAGEDFAKLAAEFSDEPRAAERGGSLGTFERDSMVKPFADAAFELDVGEVSNLVETVFGFHVIKRTQ